MTASAQAVATLEAAVLRRMKGRVPGLSVAVVGPEGPGWVRGLGLADLASRSPALPETVYMWFSMTKIVTATAVLQLWEQQRLDLDEPVARHFERFAAMQPPADAARVTIRHLLSHSSGLANPIPVSWVHLAGERPPDPGEFLARQLAKHSRLEFSPGTRSNYSNLGYLVLGEVIAAASGTSFEEYVREKILKPAGMTHTDFTHGPQMLSRAATGYQRRWSLMTPLLRAMVPRGIFGRPAGRFVPLNRFYLDGSAYGGLIGPVDDAARFLHAHLAGGRVGDWTMLSRSSVELMRRIGSYGRRYDVGLGWFRPRAARNAEHPFVEHLGGGGGFFNVMRLYSEVPLGVAVMGNATDYDIDGVTDAVARVFWES